MDKNRLRAYVTLINQLLSCPSGEELALLQAHAHLIDAEFIKVVLRVAEHAENEGATAAADYLRTLAQELTRALKEAVKEVNGEVSDRSSAYLNLIEELMGCPSGVEAEVLRANQDLIDEGLVQTMFQVSSLMEEMGERKAADFLQTIAAQLNKLLNRSSLPPEIPEEYLEILGQLLRATSKSNASAEEVYPILEANLDKLDMQFLQVMETWAQTTLPSLKSIIAQNIAIDIANLSTLIQQFPSGDPSDNFEIAIAGYEIALMFITTDIQPGIWAKIQFNLGNAYSQRVRGDKVKNLEMAIDCYRAALDLFMEESDSDQESE
jgi:tetratricopeptide (TPR) repeat protein